MQTGDVPFDSTPKRVVGRVDGLAGVGLRLAGASLTACSTLAAGFVIRDRAHRAPFAAPPSEPRPTPTLDELARDPSLADTLEPEARERLIREMAALILLLSGTPAARPTPQVVASEAEDDLIDVGTVAKIANLTRRQGYNAARRSDWRPFVIRINARVLRFRERGLRRWINANLGLVSRG